jgi:subtilisin family serine protease
MGHPGLEGQLIHEVPGSHSAACSRRESDACRHGTFVAGILLANEHFSPAGLCPNCTLLIRPVFSERSAQNGHSPKASQRELGEAVLACINAGVHVINLSLTQATALTVEACELRAALDSAARAGVLVVAAAGNEAVIGGSAITRHPWVIPVAACDLVGRPLDQSNLGNSIARNGLSAPGDRITGLGPNGTSQTISGTSAAAPFVTGTIALLLSEFPHIRSADLRFAITHSSGKRPNQLTPPLLDAWSVYRQIGSTYYQGRVS